MICTHISVCVCVCVHVRPIYSWELLNTRIDSVKRKSCKFTLIRYMHCITDSMPRHGMGVCVLCLVCVSTFCLRFTERASVEFVMVFWSEFQFLFHFSSNSMCTLHTINLYLQSHKRCTSRNKTEWHRRWRQRRWIQMNWLFHMKHCISWVRSKRLASKCE